MTRSILTVLGFTFLNGTALAAPAARTITVNGTCLRSVVPDRGAIVAVAVSQDKDLQKAAKRAGESYEAFKQGVQKLGLKNAQVTTSEYDLSEVREWEKDRSVSKGFRARMGLEIKTSDISRLGEVIALAGNQGLREVSALRTFLSEEKQKEEREACLEEAVTNAKAKASRMAKAGGAKLGAVAQINESAGGSMPPPPPPMYRAKMAMDASAEMAAPSVEAGEQNVSVAVDVVFELN